MMPSYEEPVETAKDVVKRDITPFLTPGSEIWRQFFAASPDPIYQEISRRLVITKNWAEYEEMVSKVSLTGLFAEMGTYPPWPVKEQEFNEWYRSSETIGGTFPYQVHLSNKKWPLKKVL